MTCETCQNLMMDALYGEDLDAADSSEFFEHIDACVSCRKEYLGLLQTRQWLGHWELPETSPTPVPFPVQVASPSRRRQWWPLTQKIAASILMLAGAVSLLHGAGLWNSPRLTVSQNDLGKMVTDIVVQHQSDQERVIGRALMSVAETVRLEQKVLEQETATRLTALQEQFYESVEERDRILLALTSQ